MAIVYLSLGSNLGDRERFLRLALELLPPAVTLRRVSDLYETEPVGFTGQPSFLNAVAEGETSLAPAGLLALAKGIEQQLGREPNFRWGPRVVDVDILSYDELVMESPSLTVPHPRLAERAFVLVPLAAIAPNWCHPVSGQTAPDLLRAVRAFGGVKLYKKDWWK